MFRGIFGSKDHRPAPPKNQIEVVCPACGAAQFEPRLVVSTFCRGCGAHLNIERKKVTASSSRPGGTPSWNRSRTAPTEAPEKPAVPAVSEPEKNEPASAGAGDDEIPQKVAKRAAAPAVTRPAVAQGPSDVEEFPESGATSSPVAPGTVSSPAPAEAKQSHLSLAASPASPDPDRGPGAPAAKTAPKGILAAVAAQPPKPLLGSSLPRTPALEPVPALTLPATPEPEPGPAEESVGFGAFLRQHGAAATNAAAPAGIRAAQPAESVLSPEPASSPAAVAPLTTAADAANTPIPPGAPSKPAEAPAEQPAQAVPPQAVASEIAPAHTATAGAIKPAAAPAPASAPPAGSQTTLQKMREQGVHRNQYFKDAECFQCGHKTKVSRSARSASCSECGAHIPMEDVEINTECTDPVRTRGDVMIRKRGSVIAEEVRCKDLRCYGRLEARVTASGDAVFRTSGTVVGEVHCRRFVIEKDADVLFADPVRADEVEVQARVTGKIIANGPVFIGTYGSVNGDVTARSVCIDPGGELNGGMSIVRGQSKAAESAAAPAPASAELLESAAS